MGSETKKGRRGRFDPARRQLREDLVGYFDLDLETRDRDQVRRAVYEAAGRQYLEDLGHGAKPLELLQSFIRCFDHSKGIDDLLGREKVGLNAVAEVIETLFVSYRDPSLKGATVSVRSGLTRTEKSKKELGRRAEVLRQAALIAGDAIDFELASKLIDLMLRYKQAGAPTRSAVPRRAGGPKKRTNDVIQSLDLSLDEISLQADRYRLISQLVSDFLEPKTAGQVRLMLKERYRKVRVGQESAQN